MPMMPAGICPNNSKPLIYIVLEKLSTTPYHVKDAHGEIPFIDPTFIPVGRPDVSEYEGGMMHE